MLKDLSEYKSHNIRKKKKIHIVYVNNLTLYKITRTKDAKIDI